MTFGSNTATAVFLAFGVFVFAILALVRRLLRNTRETFYVADRTVSLLPGALSVAIGWVWAPALFVASSIAYDSGLPGAFWFIVPNIACFFFFAPLAVRFRNQVPMGYTLPGYFSARYPNARRVGTAFAISALLYQQCAIVENLVGIGKLYAYYTHQPAWVAIFIMSGIIISYSLLGGLKASIITDVIQMAVILTTGLIMVPWVLKATAHIPGLPTDSIFKGAGQNASWIAFSISPGLSLLFGLLGGPLGDQMFFQRTMAIKRNQIYGTMQLAGVFFAIAPITLSVLGFIGVRLKDHLHLADSELVGPVLVSSFLPVGASLLFFALMLCALSSTVDSAYCASGVIGGRDIAARLIPEISERRELLYSRAIMIAAALVGATLAAVSRDIWFVFMTDTAMASSVLVPVALSAYWKRQSGSATFWSLILSLLVGITVSVTGQFANSGALAATAAPLSVMVGLVTSFALRTAPKRDLVPAR